MAVLQNWASEDLTQNHSFQSVKQTSLFNTLLALEGDVCLYLFLPEYPWTIYYSELLSDIRINLLRASILYDKW